MTGGLGNISLDIRFRNVYTESVDMTGRFGRYYSYYYFTKARDRALSPG